MYFLIVSELADLQCWFESTYSTDNREKGTQDHELTGDELSWESQSAVKTDFSFHHYRSQFESANEDEIYNLLTKAIMNENDSNGMLRKYV